MDWIRPGVTCMLKAGPIPRHLAFIMDGNRRFAEREAAGDLSQGHSQGFEKLLEALGWCLDLGVACVTVYAFSIENFNRSDQEVATLMELAEKKLLYLLDDGDMIRKHDLRIGVIGDLSLVPPSVREAAQKLMKATCRNRGPVLNICLAYLSTQEMAHALQTTSAVSSRKRSLETSLYTAGCPPVDLLIRTSGESRLSDFMLWQSQHALLHFTDVLWPDFSFWHLLKALVSYQSSFKARQQLSKQAAEVNQQHDVTSQPQLDQEISRMLDSKQNQISIQTASPAGPLSRKVSSSCEPGTPPDDCSDLADPIVDQDNLPTEKGQGLVITEISADARSMPAGEAAESGNVEASVRYVDRDAQQSSEEVFQKLARTAVNRRRGPDSRNQRVGNVQLMTEADLENGLFAKPSAPPVSREQQLKKNGIAGGYDSMESDEEDLAHVNGCPCCIVKFLPMHRICTDPTPAIRAIRES